jgi:hypothetical protein
MFMWLLVLAAVAVIEPAPGVEGCVGTDRPLERDQVVDAGGDLLMRARRAAIGTVVARLDGLEADDVGKLADRLERGPAAGAQIADRVGRACRAG